MAVQFFLRVLRARGLILGVFLLLTIAGIYAATHIPNDPAIERLAVANDPLAQATSDFERLFPEGEQALIILESADPLSLDALREAQQVQEQLGRIPRVQARSLLDLYRRGAAPQELTAAQAVQIRKFATGTKLFQRAGLISEHGFGIALELRVGPPAERDAALRAVDAVVLPVEHAGGPVTAVRRVGSSWLDAWLERQTGTSTQKSMPLFGVFLITLVFVIYRSWRALAAIVLTLGALVAMGIGIAWPLGWSNTVISTIVPLTILVTTTASLVYIHSRYMEPDDAPSLLEHHARALANKFLPCTASMFATAVGFGALAVSDIRPVREMGLWTAAGLVIAWVGCFTLFPAMQSLLRTPLRTAQQQSGRRFGRLVDVLVPATQRFRWGFVLAAFLLMVCGAAALFGVPRVLAPLGLEMDVLNYVNPSERVAQDTRHFEETNGLDVAELWLQTKPGEASDPQFLRAVENLTRRLESDPRITAVSGPTSLLRWARYIQTGSDQLPDAPGAWQKLAEDLEQLMLSQSSTREYVDIKDLSSVRVNIRGRARLFGPVGAYHRYIEQQWAQARQMYPALHDVTGRVVGRGVLGAAITTRLLPTLTQSFAITASVIFCAFLVVFRSPTARLMTMIPSFFAILTVFLVMRVAAIPLNIATILIASTVLGATENDQVHFFYHFQEGHAHNGTAGALRHAMLVAGRPILFATLINASGFLALALSDLPPMRQFGVVSSTAFILALLADFTALPAALWILSRYDRHLA
ncbi:MAG: MMPL family transporter [Sinobacteraceae bacterium]|nr:MMPL family transporter [Nevskiaceae bacterium]MBV9914806.1 MMPL family transporter [Nevskiaceae bacterium]